METEREMSTYEVTPFGIFLETWDGSGGIKRECIIPRDRFVEAYEKWIKNNTKDEGITNFDKLIKEERELVIDILCNNMCFDENGKIITYKDDDFHSCLSCNFRNAENCEEETKKWLNEKVR